MWGHEPKLVRKAVLVLFLEVMLYSKQSAAGLGFGFAEQDALLNGIRKWN